MSVQAVVPEAKTFVKHEFEGLRSFNHCGQMHGTFFLSLSVCAVCMHGKSLQVVIMYVGAACYSRVTGLADISRRFP